MKKLTVVLFIMLLSMVIFGCGKNNTTNVTKSEVDLSKVTIVLGDQAGNMKSKMEAAHALDGTPYKVEWATFQGAAPLFEAVRSGNVDTAIAGDTPVLSAAAAGVPMKIVSTNLASPERVAILVAKDSSIQSMSDLKGKTVAVSSAKGSIAQYLLIGALKEAGLSVDDVEIKFIMPTDALAALSAGKIEVWATFDPYMAIAESNGARVLRNGKGIDTGMGFITASDKALSDPGKRAALQDVLKRYEKSLEWGNSHVDESVKIYSDLTRLDEAIARKVTERGRLGAHEVTNEDITKLQKVADVFFEHKVLSQSLDVKNIVDQSVYPK